LSLPKLGSRGGMNCPFLPQKRIKLIVDTLNGLPGIDIADLTYSIDVYVPVTRGYVPCAELTFAVAMLAAYVRLPVPGDMLFVGQLDLRRAIRPPNAAYLQALATLLGDGMAPGVRRVVLSGAAAGMLAESFPADLPRPDVELVGVRTLDELLALLWPAVFSNPAFGAVQKKGGLLCEP
jgi:hypothetical protein